MKPSKNNIIPSQGIIGAFEVILLSIFISIVVLIYYGLYRIINLLLSPFHSAVISTSIFVILFISISIYRYINGPLITEETLEQSRFSSFFQTDANEQGIDLDEYSLDELDATQSSKAEPKQKDNPGELISDDEVPKELYVKVVQEDGYTMEDAKRETAEMQKEKDS